MSKLDQVEYETYMGVAPQDDGGNFKKITDKTRGQIKDVFIGILNSCDNFLEADGTVRISYKEARAKVDEL